MVYKEISKTNLKYNINTLKKCHEDKEIIAVVKADAYGHGVDCVGSVIRGETSWFAVSNIKEAMNVRACVCDAKILVLGPQTKRNVEASLENNLHITVNSVKNLEEIVKVANGRGVYVHLKINCGMNRYGISHLKEFNEAQNIMSAHKNIKFYGIYTHFSCVENDVFYIREQQVFANYLMQIRKDFSPFVHIGGSHCITNTPTLFDFDAIRTGIALYGYGECSKILKLKKTMKVFSSVGNVLTIKAGQSVGYSRGYVAQSDKAIAICPIGYADGVPRLMSKKILGKIGTKSVRQVGNVCMDAIMFDISGLKSPKEICVFYDADTWAKKIGTNAYEILTNFRKLRVR